MPAILRFYYGKANEAVLVVRDADTKAAIPLTPYAEVRLGVEGLGVFSTVANPDVVSIIQVSDGGATVDALLVRLGGRIASGAQVLRFPAYVDAVSGADVVRLLDATDLVVEFVP